MDIRTGRVIGDKGSRVASSNKEQKIVGNQFMIWHIKEEYYRDLWWDGYGYIDIMILIHKYRDMHTLWLYKDTGIQRSINKNRGRKREALRKWNKFPK